MALNSYFEAYEKPSSHMFEKKENPQSYDYFVSEYQHVKPKRHILGLVGGNDVYDIHYSGDSAVINYKGEKISFIEPEVESIETITLKHTDLMAFRKEFPVLNDAD